MRQNALSKIVVFISANTLGAGDKNCKSTTVKPSRAITRNLVVWTNHFELLMLKHDLAYFVYEFTKKYGMCVIMKCNAVLPGKT